MARNRSNYFDTLQYSNKMKEAGFTEKQAEAQSEALADLFYNEIATKSDVVELKQNIDSVKSELKQDIQSVRSDFKKDIESLRSDFKKDIESLRKDMELLESRIIIKFGGMLVIAVGVLAAIIKL